VALVQSRGLVTFLVLASLGCGEVCADDTSDSEKIERSAFMEADLALEQFRAIQAAVRTGTCSEVAEWVSFPFSFRPPNSRGPTVIAQSAFCRHFPVIFDSMRSRAFLDQKLVDAAVAKGGFYFGKSGIWVIAECPRDWDQPCPPGLQLRIASVDL
jgi:hypothetical protein